MKRTFSDGSTQNDHGQGDDEGDSGSLKFDCWVWSYRHFLRPAPRKPGWFAAPRKGHVASTQADTLTLTARPLKRHEFSLADAEGFAHELFPAKQQLGSKLLELLIVGAAVGLVLALALFFMPRGATEMSTLDVLTNLLVAFAAGLGLVLVGGLLISIPSLLRIRTVELFTLHFRNRRSWDFGVTPQQAKAVIQMLESAGVENRTM